MTGLRSLGSATERQSESVDADGYEVSCRADLSWDSDNKRLVSHWWAGVSRSAIAGGVSAHERGELFADSATELISSTERALSAAIERCGVKARRAWCALEPVGSGAGE